MAEARGIVREWHDDDGWGVVDAPDVPGGCWVGFGHVAVEGYRALSAGLEVALEWERARQDGFDFRAKRVWPWGAEPFPGPGSEGGGGYSSTLTLGSD